MMVQSDDQDDHNADASDEDYHGMVVDAGGGGVSPPEATLVGNTGFSGVVGEEASIKIVANPRDRELDNKERQLWCRLLEQFSPRLDVVLECCEAHDCDELVALRRA
eukprot:10354-Eustigmatos_ZCMA.PRE.1